MFDLPKSCMVNRFVPKKTFYEKLNVATGVRNEFVNLIDKIIWLYKLSPGTLGLDTTVRVEEIQVFEIYLKEKKLPKNAIKVISKVPYPILFVIKYEQDICYSIKVEDNYYTEWNEQIVLNFKGLNLETVYKNMVKVVIKEQNNEKQFEQVLQENSKKVDLMRKIEQLKSKMKSEKQFNRKVELNRELKELEAELERLINE